MKKLLLDGQGILGKEDGIQQRKLLELDTHDFSIEPIGIIVSNNIEGVSEKFGLAFLWATVYRTYNQEIPFAQNNTFQIFEDHDVDAPPTLIGPYKFHPEGGEMTNAFAMIQHRLGGALWGLQGFWERHQEKGKDGLTPILKKG